MTGVTRVDDGIALSAEDGGRETGSGPLQQMESAGPDVSTAVILDHLVQLRALGWRQAMALKDERNQVAMFERETARSRSAMEQFLAVTLTSLDDTKVSLRQAQAAQTDLTDRLRLQTARSRRLATRVSLLGADLRTKTAEVADARQERAATLAESHYQIRALASRIGVLEARLAQAEGRSVREDCLVAPSEDVLRRQRDLEVAVLDAQRQKESVRSEQARSRWIKLGRALRLTKL